MDALLIPFPNISPELFSIPIGDFNFAIRWYALAYIVAILVGWRMGVVLMRRPAIWKDQTPPMSAEQVEAYMTWCILGIILGGRLGYVLFYQPGHYLQNPTEILAIWTGGMSFHGGLIGVALASTIFALKHRLPPLQTADAIAICVPQGLLLGRLANFINAELWGRPTDVPWAVAFPGQAAQSCGQAAGQLCGRHPSQLYEAGLEGIVLGLLLWLLATRGNWLHHPGRVTAVFFAGYGIARFIVEYYRVADAQFITPDNPLGHVLSLGPLGVTMGQLLSLPMVAIGIGFWLVSRRRA